jgi:hypothetical protein
MPNQINRPANKRPPVMTMITHGRRAHGEDWRKIVIYPDPESGAYLIDNKPTEAPADNKPIFVPGMGNLSVEMADFMLERSRDAARDRAKQPRRSQAEIEAELNAAWQDYMEQKLRAFKGQSSFGPAARVERNSHGR